MKTSVRSALLGAALLLAGCAYEHHESTSMAKASLYDRLGGSYAIAAVVDDFMARLLADPVVTGNAVAVSKLPPEHVPGLTFQLTALMCEVTGGPKAYTGRSMKDVHTGMKITEAEWNAMAADFQATLDHFKVPAAEQKELFDIVGSTKADIVGV